MTVTGRLRSRKGPKAAAAIASAQGVDFARQARVAELRRLVASGGYRVEPQKLALKILVRALRDGKE